MILQRIVEFAEREVRDLPSGYQPRLVTKAIHLRQDGTLIGVIPLTGSPGSKRAGMRKSEPQESPMRTGAIKPRLITDNVNYVLGMARAKDKPGKVAERHRAWVELIEQAAKTVGHPSIQAIDHWVKSGGPLFLRESQDIASEDEITFIIDGVFPTELPEVQRFWVNLGGGSATGQCLVMGTVGPVVDRMPAPIKGIPDGQMSGTALVSVNNSAGESYGLSATLNSPISVDAAEKICNGLNILINESFEVKDDNGKARTRYRYALRVGKTVYLAWTRNKTEFDLWSFLDTPDPKQVHDLILQPITGRTPSVVEDDLFCLLSLSANAARIIVRDYHEATLPNIRQNLAKWFRRIEIAGMDGQMARPFGINRLASSLYRDANKDMPAHVPTALITSALTGIPIPDYILGLAVKRNLAMQGPFYEFNKKRYLSIERLALIKAVLETKEKHNLSALNQDHPDAAYHCGRLLAVLEQIQKAALGDINATLVDRYYGAACTSPGTILGSLVNDAQSHLAKLRKGRGDTWAQIRLGEVLCAIGSEFPLTLSLSRQGLFALGYYHQKANDIASAIEAKANKEANNKETEE